MNTLYKKCRSAGLRPMHVAEVGVHLPEMSNVLDFIREGIRTTLVEPDPAMGRRIRTYFADQPLVTLHEVAASDEMGTIELVQRGPSTFMRQLALSPALANDQYTIRPEDCFTVAAVPFSQLDDGTIDLLSVDIEGGEWFVVKHLRSRPAVISLETHSKFYDNPFLPQILGWMARNQYRIWYKDDTDTVFIRTDAWPATVSETLRLRLTEGRLSTYRAWKRALRRLRGR